MSLLSQTLQQELSALDDLNINGINPYDINEEFRKYQNILKQQSLFTQQFRSSPTNSSFNTSTTRKSNRYGIDLNDLSDSDEEEQENYSKNKSFSSFKSINTTNKHLKQSSNIKELEIEKFELTLKQELNKISKEIEYKIKKPLPQPSPSNNNNNNRNVQSFVNQLNDRWSNEIQDLQNQIVKKQKDRINEICKVYNEDLKQQQLEIQKRKQQIQQQQQTTSIAPPTTTNATTTTTKPITELTTNNQPQISTENNNKPTVRFTMPSTTESKLPTTTPVTTNTLPTMQPISAQEFPKQQPLPTTQPSTSSTTSAQQGITLDELRKQQEEQQQKPIKESTTSNKDKIKISIPTKGTSASTYIRAYLRIQEMDKIMASFETLKQNDSNFRKLAASDVRKPINKLLNQVAAAADVIRRLKNEFYKIFEHFKTLQAPMAKELFNYALFVYADGVISQAEVQSSDTKKLFPYAKITSELMLILPELQDAVLGLIYKRCPYAIPQYVQWDKQKQSSAEYKKALGFKFDEDTNTFEDKGEYLKRMKSILILYASIIQSDVNNHSHGISFGWIWLATILNMHPMIYTAEMLDCFLEIAGFKLFKTYGKQFAKVIDFLEVHFLPKLPAETDAGSKARLLSFITKFKKSQTITPPEGRE
ncbi:hypothetical protein ABK040_015551 [Willaertia magna]